MVDSQEEEIGYLREDIQELKDMMESMNNYSSNSFENEKSERNIEKIKAENKKIIEKYSKSEDNTIFVNNCISKFIPHPSHRSNKNFKVTSEVFLTRQTHSSHS